MATLVQNGVETQIDYGLMKVTGELPFNYLLEGDYEQALKAYQREQRNNPKSGLLSERILNNTGYQEFAKKNYDIALWVFKIYTILYPESSNAFDSLGEYYMEMDNKKLALVNYNKSLVLDPNNGNAKMMITRILKE